MQQKTSFYDEGKLWSRVVMMVNTDNGEYQKWVLVADGGAAGVFQKSQAYEEIYAVKSKHQHHTSKQLVTDKDGTFYASRHHTKDNARNQHSSSLDADFIIKC
ncbi:hypothetical protein [Marinicella sp. W31]|uniref:hypothetical protein n=1 Tax=Marinicella sp. W31 TaxID=3023713 RepID=UPI00375694D2